MEERVNKLNSLEEQFAQHEVRESQEIDFLKQNIEELKRTRVPSLVESEKYEQISNEYSIAHESSQDSRFSIFESALK
jgi:hypothetical protein